MASTPTSSSDSAEVLSVAAVKRYQCNPSGDLLLIMSRQIDSKSGSKDDQSAETDSLDLTDLVGESDGESDGDSDGYLYNGENQGEFALFPDNDISTANSSGLRPTEYHFLVSSQCMILASPVFKAMLRGGFKGGLQLGMTGELILRLPDDDPDIFLVLLNIIHGHNRKVPRLVSLVRLTELAILVDKYQMLERVEMFSDMWLAGLEGKKGGIPESFTSDILPWLSISSVFRQEEAFQKVTKILQTEGDYDMGGEALQRLPISEWVINDLQESRLRVLGRIFAEITSTIERYQKPSTICHRPEDPKLPSLRIACDAMALGTLLKSCVKADIWPNPSCPYRGFTIRRVMEDINTLTIRSLCEVNKDGMYGRKMHDQRASHDEVQRTINWLKSHVAIELKGLKLEDYLED